MILVPAFPLGTTYLPGEAVILRVFEERYLKLLHDVEETTGRFVSVLIEAGSEVGGGEKRFDTGVLVVVDHVAPADFGFQLFAHADRVIDVLEWNDDVEYPRAHVAEHLLDAGNPQQAHESLQSLSLSIRAFVEHVRVLGLATGNFEHLESILDVSVPPSSHDEAWSVFWRLAGLVPCTPLDKYEFLRSGDLVARAQRVEESLAHMTDLLTFRYGQ